MTRTTLFAALLAAVLGAALTLAVTIAGQSEPASLASRVAALESQLQQTEETAEAVRLYALLLHRRLEVLESADVAAAEHEHELGAFAAVTHSGSGSSDVYRAQALPAGRYRLTATRAINHVTFFSHSGFSPHREAIFVSTRELRDGRRTLEFWAHEGFTPAWDAHPSLPNVAASAEFAVRVNASAGPWTMTIERIGDLPTLED